jgi:hypothetical protein
MVFATRLKTVRNSLPSRFLQSSRFLQLRGGELKIIGITDPRQP